MQLPTATASALKLGAVIINDARVAPEEEDLLAATVRAGINSPRPEVRFAHFTILAGAPPRVAARVLWEDRAHVEDAIAGR